MPANQAKTQQGLWAPCPWEKGKTSSTNLIFLLFVNASFYEGNSTLKVTSIMNIRELRLFVDSERVLWGKLLNSKS
jgi:hypothetical protein